VTVALVGALVMGLLLLGTIASSGYAVVRAVVRRERR
jgi:hypothetical protein